MTRVAILTGDELRHEFVRKAIAASPGIEVVVSCCEGAEKGLGARVEADAGATELMRRHVAMRTRSEEDFFRACVDRVPDASNPVRVPKGAVNDPAVVEDILSRGPELVVCYGSSIIRGRLLEAFAGRFLNVHLGISPQYRGSGTNAWALVNRQPEYVGATFMHIDAGVDTGEIIHQIRARVYDGDGPHQIGNRLISDMATAYADVVRCLPRLPRMPQPPADGGRCYLQKDFDAAACDRLYRNFAEGMVAEYLANREAREQAAPIVVNPAMPGEERP